MPQLQRIPVLSFFESLPELVRNRLANGSGLASQLYRDNKLSLHKVQSPNLPIQVDASASQEPVRFNISPDEEELLANAEIAIMDAHITSPLLLTPEASLFSDQRHLFQQVQWVQNTYAGVEAYTRLLDARKARGVTELPAFTATRAGGIMPMAIAQYVFGNIIALERNLYNAREYQKSHIYANVHGVLDQPMRYRPFRNLTVGVLGFGDIGQAIGKLFKTAEFNVTGFKRRVPEDGVASFTDCADKITSDLDEVLATSDFIVSILPSTEDTRYLLNHSNLQACQDKRPIFVNVGRGDVIAEQTIVDALDNGWFSHAVLDVFEQEPLPQESKLWDHPNVQLTPHVSGFSFPEDVAYVFEKNLNAYLSGKPLQYKVDWKKGY